MPSEGETKWGSEAQEPDQNEASMPSVYNQKPASNAWVQTISARGRESKLPQISHLKL